MLSKPPKILFISHDASMSGAPILLLNLLRLLINSNKASIDVVISRDGVLSTEFKKAASTTVLKPVDYGKETSIFHRLKNFLNHKVKLIRLIKNLSSYDLIVSNTIVNGKLLKQLSIRHIPVVTYVHELEGVIELYNKQGDAGFSLKHSSLFAYPSAKVKNLLVDKYRIEKRKLARLHYYFPVQASDIIPSLLRQKKVDFRRKYGLSDNEFVVGNMGTVSERKGTDIFINVCEKVVALYPAITFCWIGGFRNKEHELEIKQITESRNLSEKIIFTGPLGNELYNTAAFDLLFLSSREDPYPLVVLEAALMHVPTLCFSESGGIVEFVGSDAGWQINDFSISEAANKVLKLASDKAEVRKKADKAFDKVIDLHCNPELVLSQFSEIINQVLRLN
jgi:glycosyltransferase involved in cell wall biosynthesis